VTTEEVTHIGEVRARLDAAATMAAQGLLGELELATALRGVLGLVEASRLQLKALGQ
jgi:hypothetical protein